MRITSFALLILLICQSAFSQSKKEQIEVLIFQKDSLVMVTEELKQKARIFKVEQDQLVDTKNSKIIEIEKKLMESLLVIEEKDKMLLNIQKELKLFFDSTKTLKAELTLLKSQNIKTIIIGQQVWMAENLNVDKFQNGDPILEAKTSEEWTNAGLDGKPAWCCYNNDPKNCERYGKLYNSFAINDPRGLVPEGWHIPTDLEWTLLTDYLGGESLAGPKMKFTNFWSENGNGTNESGFSGLPGGSRPLDGTFDVFGYAGYWWVSTKHEKLGNWGFGLQFENSAPIIRLNSTILENNNISTKGLGISVRALKD